MRHNCNRGFIDLSVFLHIVNILRVFIDRDRSITFPTTEMFALRNCCCMNKYGLEIVKVIYICIFKKWETDKRINFVGGRKLDNILFSVFFGELGGVSKRDESICKCPHWNCRCKYFFRMELYFWINRYDGIHFLFFSFLEDQHFSMKNCICKIRISVDFQSHKKYCTNVLYIFKIKGREKRNLKRTNGFEGRNL